MVLNESSTIFKSGSIINYINQLRSLTHLHSYSSLFAPLIVSCITISNFYLENFSFHLQRIVPQFYFCGQHWDCLRWFSNSIFEIFATYSDLNPHQCKLVFSSNYDPAAQLVVFNLAFIDYRGQTTPETPAINDILRYDVSPNANSPTHSCKVYFPENPNTLRISADGQF